METVLDELTAEAMKINISPEMVTSEMRVKLKKASEPGQTYRAEAQITDVSPPKVTIRGAHSARTPQCLCALVSLL